jgi:hypothetical protein
MNANEVLILKEEGHNAMGSAIRVARGYREARRKSIRGGLVQFPQGRLVAAVARRIVAEHLQGVSIEVALKNRRLEFQLGVWFVGPRGFVSVLFTARALEHGLSRFGRANLHPRRNPLDRQR